MNCDVASARSLRAPPSSATTCNLTCTFSIIVTAFDHDSSWTRCYWRITFMVAAKKPTAKVHLCDAIAELYGFQAKGDFGFMRGVHTPDVQQLAELTTYAKHDAEVTYQLAALLLPQITRPDVELPILMHTVRLFTERLDHGGCPGHQPARRRYQRRKRAALWRGGCNAVRAVERSAVRATADGGARTHWTLSADETGQAGYDPGDCQNGRSNAQALLDDDDPVVATLAPSARLNKKGQDQKLARLSTLSSAHGPRADFLPPYLDYFGSHTGRLFRRRRLQHSESPSRGPGGQSSRPSHFPAGLQIRHRRFAANRGAQIMAVRPMRPNMLQVFAQGIATRIGVCGRCARPPVRKPVDGDPPNVHERLIALCEVGKKAVLGLGFGMGGAQVHGDIAQPTPRWPNFSPKVNSLVDLPRKIAPSYCADYPGIPGFWAALEKATRAVIGGKEMDAGCIALW